MLRCVRGIYVPRGTVITSLQRQKRHREQSEAHVLERDTAIHPIDTYGGK